VDTIVEAAARVLLHRGYAGATTNRIAERAGVSVGTLYQYFAGKDDVFDALIRRETSAVLAALGAEPIDPSRPLEDTLRRTFASLLRAMAHGPELIRQLECVPNALLRRRVAERKGRSLAFVRSLLEAHRAELQVEDLDLAAFLVVNASEGVGVNASPELFGERLADELTRLFARYLTGRSAGETAWNRGARPLCRPRSPGAGRAAGTGS
jgi:AcrR family transcriptional regulator